MIDSLIERCHERHENSLHQQQTVVLPAISDAYAHHYQVHYAQDRSAPVCDFEQADISVLPIGKAPFDRAPADWLRKDSHRNRVDEWQGARDYRTRQWFASWGIGIYTGVTSGTDNANWHDVEFTYQAILDEPDTTLVCLEALIHAVKDPLVTLTRDGGVRFTCRVPDYFHSNTVADKFYVHKDDPTPDNAYVIIKGEQDYSVWDARHEILMGSVFNPPVISSDVLFALLRVFKSLLGNPAWYAPDMCRVYTPKALDVRDTTKSLSVDEKAVCVSQQMQDIRDGRLSPLSLQRPEPVIAKRPLTDPVDISNIATSDADVIGIQTGICGYYGYHEIISAIESHFGEDDRICIFKKPYPSTFFTSHNFSINAINNYIQYWRGLALCDFGHAIRNALQIIESDKTDDIVARVRSVVSAFENIKETLIAQMYEVDGANDTYWHQLKRFFDHYPRDEDAPMDFDGHQLHFRLPPIIPPHAEKIIMISPSIDVSLLQRVFPDKKAAVYNYNTQEALAGNRVYQLRSEVHSPHSLLNYDLDWDALSLSAVGARYAVGMHHYIRRTPETQHTIVSTDDMDTALSDTVSGNNAHFLFFGDKDIHAQFKNTDVIWVFGTPHFPPRDIWWFAKVLYGDMSEPLDYTVSMNPYRFKDPRLQQVSEAYSRLILTGILALTMPLKAASKTIVIQTALWLPGITDAPETRLFDWEDFEVADGLERLDAVIDRREQYEAEAAQIDASWMPYQIMPILGVDYKEAERLLIETHGREQFVRTVEEVVALLFECGGPMQLKEIKAALAHRSPSSIEQSLYRLVHEGVVVKLRQGLYRLKTG